MVFMLDLFILKWQGRHSCRPQSTVDLKQFTFFLWSHGFASWEHGQCHACRLCESQSVTQGLQYHTKHEGKYSVAGREAFHCSKQLDVEMSGSPRGDY